MGAERIFVGGFSQGGAAAIHAGLTCEDRLGGVMAISSWCPHRADLAVQARRDVPVLFSCGTADPTVDFRLSRRSGELLAELLGPQATVHHEQRSKHWAKASEIARVAEFML